MYNLAMVHLGMNNSYEQLNFKKRYNMVTVTAHSEYIRIVYKKLWSCIGKIIKESTQVVFIFQIYFTVSHW